MTHTSEKLLLLCCGAISVVSSGVGEALKISQSSGDSVVPVKIKG